MTTSGDMYLAAKGDPSCSMLPFSCTTDTYTIVPDFLGSPGFTMGLFSSLACTKCHQSSLTTLFRGMLPALCVVQDVVHILCITGSF